VLQRAFIRPTPTQKLSASSPVPTLWISTSGPSREPPPSDAEKKAERGKKLVTVAAEDGGKVSAEANPAVDISAPLNSTPMIHKLHGSLPQPVRTAALASFTACKSAAVLFGTDVAARGLDLPNVDLVLQFDPPFSLNDHLHPIGRTAHAGREGRAVIFLLPGAEEGYVESTLKKGIREGSW
jgi:ATP-dependent RNA helicase DDX31/DBP7